MKRDNPICGNCLKPFDDHYFESEIFCFPDTTGDYFTDEPQESLITDKLIEIHKETYDRLVLDWKRDNGHI